MHRYGCASPLPSDASGYVVVEKKKRINLYQCPSFFLDHLHALPTTKKGKCLAVPTVEELQDNPFCWRTTQNETIAEVEVEINGATVLRNETKLIDITYEVDGHTSKDICMYCVTGQSRKAAGLLTAEWKTCRIDCEEGKIVSCDCSIKNEDL